MSGGKPVTLDALFRCPFCGRKAIRVSLPNQMYDPKSKLEFDDLLTKFGDGSEFPELVLRVEDTAILADSAHCDCPAMSESGAYFLKFRPSGEIYAEYY